MVPTMASKLSAGINGMFIKTTPVRSMLMVSAPMSPPQMLPAPPVISTPPTTAEAIALSSNPSPEATRMVVNWLNVKIPVTPASAPVMMKLVTFTRLTATPWPRAAPWITARREHVIAKSSLGQDKLKDDHKQNQPDEEVLKFAFWKRLFRRSNRALNRS